MNLSSKLFVLFLAASFALIAYKPDAIATALIPATLCASLCFNLWLTKRNEQRGDDVDAKLRTLKERLDMLIIQKGLSR